MEMTRKTLNEVSDAMNGLDFLRKSNGKYKLLATTKDDGTISITLNEICHIGDNVAMNDPIIELDMGDIYAQCAPARIIERLSRNIIDTGDMIKTIKADSHEAAPEPDIDFSATDTPF